MDINEKIGLHLSSLLDQDVLLLLDRSIDPSILSGFPIMATSSL